MIVADESEKCWSGGGLTLECLEPHRRWKIAFQGLLRKGPYRQQWSDEEGELVHVKFSLCWTTFTDVFDFKFDSHPDSFARALALEKWSRELFQRIKRDGEQHSRYEQWGQQIGEIEIENHQKKELFLRGIRTHSYGIRNWEEFYRYVMLLMHFEDGTSAHLTVLCKPATTTHLAVGYVLFPNGKKAGIDWTDALLAEMADDGIIKDTYRVTFTADGKSFSVCATLDKEARPMVYNGSAGKGVFHECIADFQLNSLLRGWGLVEFYYRDELGDLIPYANSPLKLKEPSLPASSKFVVSFTEEHSQCTKEVGGKGAQIGQLTHLQGQLGSQFIVPPGFCVTVLALEHHIKQNQELQEAVKELTQVACKIKPGNLQELCKRCSEMFNTTRLSREIEDAVLQRLDELGLQQKLLAVRSSPVGEDTTERAAAGQLYSELGVRGRQQVWRAILACWASLYSFPAVRYRHQRGQLIPSLMGVVIQQMVPAEAAGTLFTCDPLTGHPGKIIIKANYGIGESTVTGNVEPDTITLLHSPKNGLQVTSKKIGSKKQYAHLSVGGTMMLEDSHPTETSQCCISDDMFLKVAGLALWVRKAYGTARDIEWAVKENLIYFLQARPMTSFSMESDFELMHEFDTGLPSDLQWLTTATISEAAPGAITPLTWSVFGTATQYVIQQLGALNGGLCQLKLHSLRGLDMYCGHLFLSILSSAASCEPSNVVNQKNNPLCSPVEKELNELGSHDIILQCLHLSPWRKIFSFKFMKFLLNTSSKQRYWEEQLQNFNILSGSNAAEAYLHLTKMLPEYFSAYLTSVLSSSASILWASYLIDTLSQGENKLTAEAIALLCKNCPDALSTELPHSVEVIIQAVRDQGNSAEFAKMDSQTAVSWLLSADSGEAGKAFQSFLKRHGFFSFGEAELRSKPWADDPTQLIPLIQRAVESKHISKKKTQTSVEEAIAAVKIPVTGLRKIIIPFLVRKARDGISKREYSKTLARKVYALFKTAYWELARQMVKEGFLPDEDLLFFLTHSEVGEILQHRPLDIILRANRRRRILDQQNLLQFPEVNMGRPVPLRFKEVADLTAEAVLSGIIISQGVAKGTARVLKSVAEASSIQQGDILIVAIPEVGWTYYFPLLGGLVTEIGGILSHGGIIAREYGLPCIMKCKGATICFKSGDKVILDGFKGTVRKLEE